MFSVIVVEVQTAVNECEFAIGLVVNAVSFLGQLGPVQGLQNCLGVGAVCVGVEVFIENDQTFLGSNNCGLSCGGGGSGGFLGGGSLGIRTVTAGTVISATPV